MRRVGSEKNNKYIDDLWIYSSTNILITRDNEIVDSSGVLFITSKQNKRLHKTINTIISNKESYPVRDHLFLKQMPSHTQR